MKKEKISQKVFLNDLYTVYDEVADIYNKVAELSDEVAEDFRNVENLMIDIAKQLNVLKKELDDIKNGIIRDISFAKKLTDKINPFKIKNQ